MKIALLNLPIDDNYGGNLQRFALVKVLQDLGHDVTHLLVMRKIRLVNWRLPIALVKRLILRFIFGKKVYIWAERHYKQECQEAYNRIRPFYDKYVKHTEVITDYKNIKNYNFFDAYVVGSDQAWRQKIIRPFPLKMFLWDFINASAKKIAYAVSLGNSEPELDNESAGSLKKYYNQFRAVSVREKSAIDVLDKYGWNNPKAEWLVDPTMLLKKDDYLEVVDNAETFRMDGDIFCYILDPTKEKMEYINNIAKEKNMKPFVTGLHKLSIEQWLRNFADAEYIVTDSYHGLVFSMIFNKPVKLFFNIFRGNARFESLFELLGITSSQIDFDWNQINGKMLAERRKAVNWLNSALDS